MGRVGNVKAALVGAMALAGGLTWTKHLGTPDEGGVFKPRMRRVFPFKRTKHQRRLARRLAVGRVSNTRKKRRERRRARN